MREMKGAEKSEKDKRSEKHNTELSSLIDFLNKNTIVTYLATHTQYHIEEYEIR
jgi:hypothetical protein